MSRFANKFLDTNEPTRKDVNLVRALVDLIRQDQSIAADEMFYIEPNGEKKAALGDLKKVCLPSFLLGVWHYIIMNRGDNTVGEQTCAAWCPTNYKAPRKYKAHMGRGILGDLTVYSPLDDEDKPDTDDEPEDAKIAGNEPAEVVVMEDVPSPPLQQTVNNPFVFNFNQYGNNGTQIGHIENNYAGKTKEDRGNE